MGLFAPSFESMLSLAMLQRMRVEGWHPCSPRRFSERYANRTLPNSCYALVPVTYDEQCILCDSTLYAGSGRVPQSIASVPDYIHHTNTGLIGFIPLDFSVLIKPRLFTRLTSLIFSARSSPTLIPVSRRRTARRSGRDLGLSVPHPPFALTIPPMSRHIDFSPTQTPAKEPFSPDFVTVRLSAGEPYRPPY
jgi:hypothetical protein